MAGEEESGLGLLEPEQEEGAGFAAAAEAELTGPEAEQQMEKQVNEALAPLKEIAGKKQEVQAEFSEATKRGNKAAIIAGIANNIAYLHNVPEKFGEGVEHTLPELLQDPEVRQAIENAYRKDRASFSILTGGIRAAFKQANDLMKEIQTEVGQEHAAAVKPINEGDEGEQKAA